MSAWGNARLAVHALKSGLLAALVFLCLPAAAARLPNGAAAGDVTATTAVLWARASVPGRVLFEYGESPSFADAARGSVEVEDATIPAKLAIRRLAPGHTFYYRATDAAGNTSSGTFRTPAEGRRAGLRFGVSGDWRGDLAPFVAVRNVPSRNLDFFVELGDTVYADVATPALPRAATTLPELRAKHAEVQSGRYGVNAWAEVHASTSILAMLDDHEVVDDFAGGALPGSDRRFDGPGGYINETRLFRDGVRAFLDYMPLREERYGDTGDSRTAGKIKLYRSYTYGLDAAVFMLDARSFRDAPLPAITSAALAPVAAFLGGAFDPRRTLLGQAQLSELKADLIKAQAAGVTWKFIMLPEPIQNLGLPGASDRYEGYAAERTELLAFIEQQEIQNVVFVSADVHGTLVNDLGYRSDPRLPDTRLKAWEITTGPVAYGPTFGPATIDALRGVGLLSDAQGRSYDALRVRHDSDEIPNDKDDLVRLYVDTELRALGHTPLGLADSAVEASLLAGDYVALHTYGWTEFQIDAASQRLTVTTWGVDAYGPRELAADTQRVLKLEPQVVSRFEVEPEPGAAGIRAQAQPTTALPTGWAHRKP